MVKVIAENPERFPAIRKDHSPRCAAPLSIQHFYRIVAGHVVVIACFHGKRNPNVWRSRK
jgi:hypothetical protein